MRLVQSIFDIDATHWDGLVAASGGNEFVSYAFLSALEKSGCVGERSGWQPYYVMDDVGAMPMFLKSHSMGEYVFDSPFANAYTRAGGEYYPKLQIASPFSPVSGARLLGDCSGLIDGVCELAQNNGLSSVHVTFCTEAEQKLLAKHGFLSRIDTQFHFMNDGYGDFKDFLTTLSSDKRKNLRKEREKALAGLEIEVVSGLQITEAHLDDFFAFYKDTGRRKWGKPYLNRAFFSLLSDNMREKLLFIFAKRAGKRIAGAMNVIGKDRIFGRYWGAIEQVPFLHFELSYYQAIDWAIAHKKQVVEAGAQGEHKLARGYAPVTTFSAHYFTHDGLRDAVAGYLKHERQQVDHSQEVMVEMLPFKVVT